jgi:hypothetical protein
MKSALFLLLMCAFAAAAQTKPALRDDLLKMRDRDQTAREECNQKSGDEQIKCYVKISETIDQPNTKRLNQIFAQEGFPTLRLVGKEGLEAFMLMLQHTADETLRQKCLKPITKAFKRREIPPMAYTNYVDRLLVHQGKPQIYGSNFDFKDGKLVMSPVKDRKNLAKRRRRAGLPTIEEYAAVLKEMYHLEIEIPAP